MLRRGHAKFVWRMKVAKFTMPCRGNVIEKVMREVRTSAGVKGTKHTRCISGTCRSDRPDDD